MPRYYRIVTLNSFNLTLSAYTVFFSLLCILVWIMVLLSIFITVSVHLNGGVLNEIWALRLVRVLAGTFVTMLFIPGMRNLLAVFSCTGGQWTYFPDVECFGTQHAPYVGFAVGTIMVYVLYAFGVAGMVFDFVPS